VENTKQTNSNPKKSKEEIIRKIKVIRTKIDAMKDGSQNQEIHKLMPLAFETINKFLDKFKSGDKIGLINGGKFYVKNKGLIDQISPFALQLVNGPINNEEMCVIAQYAIEIIEELSSYVTISEKIFNKDEIINDIKEQIDNFLKEFKTKKINTVEKHLGTAYLNENEDFRELTTTIDKNDIDNLDSSITLIKRIGQKIQSYREVGEQRNLTIGNLKKSGSTGIAGKLINY
jgi:hypothetical protein